jgi:hypothetical protein
MISEVITFEEINEIVKGLIRARLGKQLIVLSCVARMEREREREDQKHQKHHRDPDLTYSKKPLELLHQGCFLWLNRGSGW